MKFTGGRAVMRLLAYFAMFIRLRGKAPLCPNETATCFEALALMRSRSLFSHFHGKFTVSKANFYIAGHLPSMNKREDKLLNVVSEAIATEVPLCIASSNHSKTTIRLMFLTFFVHFLHVQKK